MLPAAPQPRKSNLVAHRLPSLLGKNQNPGVKYTAFVTIYQIQFFHLRDRKTCNQPMMTKSSGWISVKHELGMVTQGPGMIFFF